MIVIFLNRLGSSLAQECGIDARQSSTINHSINPGDLSQKIKFVYIVSSRA